MGEGEARRGARVRQGEGGVKGEDQGVGGG